MTSPLVFYDDQSISGRFILFGPGRGTYDCIGESAGFKVATHDQALMEEEGKNGLRGYTDRLFKE